MGLSSSMVKVFSILCLFNIFQSVVAFAVHREPTGSYSNFGKSINTRSTLAPGFAWGTDPMRGVNIGGWLVLEPWITPSLFEDKPDWVVDEWTYGEYMATQDDPMEEITNHWNTWFQYAELSDIASVGLNTIRIQIGYWSVISLSTDEPYLVGAYDYLKLAVTWASNLNLKVMVDLHGAPGGQNGFDNSGISNTRQWFANDTNISRTLSALQILTAEFTQSFYNDTVIAIELINEPYPYTAAELDVLKDFYQSAYTVVRNNDGGNGVVVAIDEGFQGLQTWEAFMEEPEYSNITMDTHIYTQFDLSLISMGYDKTIEYYCGQEDYILQSNDIHWTIVGEFTPANTDCAYWLNGRGLGARYDNSLNTSAALAYPGDCSGKTGSDPSSFSSEYTEFLANSFETQTWVYEKASGWIMWTWKTEEAADWSMQIGITYGWIPNPIYSKPHGTPCSSNSSTSSSSSSKKRNTMSWWWLLATGVSVLLYDGNIEISSR